MLIPTLWFDASDNTASAAPLPISVELSSPTEKSKLPNTVSSFLILQFLDADWDPNARKDIPRFGWIWIPPVFLVSTVVKLPIHTSLFVLMVKSSGLAEAPRPR